MDSIPLRLERCMSSTVCSVQDSRVTRLTYVGPIVRINPYELHVNDPAFIDQVYASGASRKKRDKDVLSCARTG